MSERLPINGEVLAWARKTLGIDIDELAAKMKISSDQLDAWETGVDGPTYAQLERLANQFLKRPIALFFFPSVPEEDTVKTDFRTLPGTLLETLPTQIIKAYRKAKTLQLSLEELFNGEPPVENPLVQQLEQFRAESDDTLLAELRNRLGLSVDQQFEWRSADIAFKTWREAFETRGVFVFKDAFRDDNYSGFCLYHELYPVIYVNNSMPATRQVFTLFHELYHLLINSGGVDFANDEMAAALTAQFDRVERASNRFANHFLVPPSHFDKEALSPTQTNIERLANRYCVSREVVLRNLLDRDIVSSEVYEDFVHQWMEERSRSKRSGAGSYYNNQIAYLGRRYLDLAFGKYYSGSITVDQLSEYLHTKVKNVETLELRAFGSS